MRRAALLAALVLCTGCAAGRVHGSGDIEGVALGHARLARNADGATSIEGGELSSTAAGVVSAAIAAALAYFTFGGVAVP